ncbi:MAG: hypothetical protein ACRDZO_04100 [Egibacteraceae bacterium]
MALRRLTAVRQAIIRALRDILIHSPQATPPYTAVYEIHLPAPEVCANRCPFRYRGLIHRLLRGVCEICQGTDDIQVHHVRKLADLTAPGRADTPAWMKTMARMRRKSLIVCGCCHDFIHTG